jgi:tripartite-type tricarboxylate transporter receptor subunit TctC
MKLAYFFSGPAALLLAIIAVSGAAAGHYPERGIRLLYGFPPGADTVVRMLADRLAEILQKPIIVENLTGAGGNIVADHTAKAKPDGYTFGMLNSASIVINPSLYSKLPYDPVKDLAPVTQVWGYPNVLVVNNDVPVKDVDGLVNLARAEPGKLSFGHSGFGTTQHLAGELFKSMAGVDIQGVTYRGPPQITADLLAGRISMSFLSTGGSFWLMRERKIRPLAVTASTRASFFPDLPTMREVGFPGFELNVWFGLFAPAATPASIVEKMNRLTVQIMRSEDVRRRLDEIGFAPLGNTPAQFAAVIAAEIPYWARLIKEHHIKQIDSHP